LEVFEKWIKEKLLEALVILTSIIAKYIPNIL
jgi:hypothetical protein